MFAPPKKNYEVFIKIEGPRQGSNEKGPHHRFIETFL